MARSLETAELSNVYVLTARGQLGYFDENHHFVVDSDLSARFADYNQRFIQTYLQAPESVDFRLALTYRPASPRRWRGETLLLTQHTLRTFYPARQARSDELTEFQKRNREMSLYRGLELFLEYRSDIAPHCAVYCPVIINRNTLLDRYQHDIGTKTGEPDTQPVFEVLNLLALIPLRERNTPDVMDLCERLYRRTIDKDLREPLEMRLMESGRRRSRAEQMATALSSWRNEPRLEEPKSSAPAPEALPTPAQANPDIVDAALLQRFDRFRNTPTETLNRFGERLQIQTYPPGTIIARAGDSDNWSHYLVSGVVQLEADDHTKHTIAGGSDQARDAIANLKPRRYTVTAVSAVSLVKIDASAEAALLRTSTPVGFELH